MPAMSATAAASQGSSQSFEPSADVSSAGAGDGALTVGCGALANGSVGAVAARRPAGAGVGATAGGAVDTGAELDGPAVPAVRSRGVSRGWAGRSVAVAGGGVCASGRGVGAAVEAGVSSAGRVFVPGRLKFCSSRGPTASVAGVAVLVVAGAGCAVFWASAVPGRNIAPAANTIFKRKPALIKSRSAWVAVTCRGASAHARVARRIQAQRR